MKWKPVSSLKRVVCVSSNWKPETIVPLKIASLILELPRGLNVL